jgi:hypothetical protein
MFELAPQGLVPPEDVARLLLPPGGDAGPRAFGAPPRPHALLAALAPALDAYAGTAVGAVFLVEDRPVAAHVFGRHDLFVAALPDLVPGVAAAARERPRRTGVDARAVALAWLRAAARNGTGWSESCGEGSETTVIDPRQRTAGHAVTDERGTLVHAAFHVAAAWPGSAPLVRRDPVPPVDPDETSRGASVRPTAAEQRRREREPEPGGKAPDGVRNP